TLHIELQKQDGAHIIEELRIYNELGQLMCRHERIPTKFFVRVDNYPPGRYQVVIKSNIKTESKSIVIE
ncbi:MAG TPA: T9SS type A sorting domain-containing protein, partial [Luteibaculaceae bacterium]|nr:T9SS type A sorting domain-containing protein [Luteibaculaceae bacterium]